MSPLTKKQLESYIDTLENENLISAEQAINIRNYNSEQIKNFKILNVLAVLGVILIAMGIIYIGAYNWQYLPGSVKILLSIIPLVVLVVYLVIKDNQMSELRKQCVVLGVGFATMFAIGIICQVYQTPVSVHWILWVSAISLIPLVYSYSAYWLAVVLAPVLATCYLSDFNVLFALGPFVLAPFYYRRQIVEREGCRCLTLCMVAVVITLPIVIFDVFNLHDWNVAISGLTLLLLYLLLNDEFYEKVMRVVFYIFLYGCTFMYEYELGMGLDTILPLITILPLLVGVVLLLCLRVMPIKDKVFLGVVTMLLIFCAIPDAEILVTWSAVVLLTCLLMYDVQYHYHNLDIQNYNKSNALLSFYVISRMFTTDLLLVVKGALFIVIGVLFIIANKKFVERVKGGTETVTGGVADE